MTWDFKKKVFMVYCSKVNNKYLQLIKVKVRSGTGETKNYYFWVDIQESLEDGFYSTEHYLVYYLRM